MKLKEECGIFGGISFSGDIAPSIRKGLFMLQHRGQESAGICCGNYSFEIVKNKGLVMEALPDSAISNLRGRSGIGHVRYSTQGESDTIHAQPFLINYLGENVSIAHNGNVVSAMDMRQELENAGEIFLTSSDTEMILKKVVLDIHKKPSEWSFKGIGEVLDSNFNEGSWSLLFGFAGRVMGFRDPYGYRPLMFCEAEEGYFLSSEDCAFQLLTPKKIIEIQPGEGIEITADGYTIKRFSNEKTSKKCVFEHIYFAKPVSNIFGRNVYTTRVDLGRKCAEENHVDADVIVPVMDSGFPSAIGYSEKSGIPMHMGLLRNHWVGRTFIEPGQLTRAKKVRQKLTPIEPVIKDKRVILVDDSLVRGTTSRELVRMLKKTGAKEVHFRLASPMLVNSCLWGIDIPTCEELIANSFDSAADIADFIEADSIGYLSFKGLKDIFGQEGWCYHCFEKACPLKNKQAQHSNLAVI